MKPKITIIGAGIAGLTAAVYLNKKGFEVQIEVVFAAEIVTETLVDQI